MRTATAPELALLASARVNHYVKIEVTNASGTWKDLTSLSGIDWVDSWEIDGEAIDRQVATAKLSIRRDITTGSKSLAPLMVGSPLNVNDAAAYAPLLDLGRAVRITTAVTAAGVAPVSGDWKEMFLGRINAINWESSPIEVDCSDMFTWIVDRFIETEDTLGSDSGATIESILQELLHAWPPLPGEPTLYTPDSPAWILPTAFLSSKKALSEMMKELVDQIAWELRYRYDASGVSRLTLFEPPRTKTVSDATVSPAMYRAVRKLALAIDDIRNAVVVNYLNDDSSPATTLSEDATSAGKYGRRYMELPAGNNIHAAAEAQALGDAAVSDLADPFAEQEVELLYYWVAQLYDLFTFSANADHYDADVQLAVIGVKHAGANGEIITTLTCRGSVAGAYAAWLKRARASNPTAGTPATSILRVSSTESADGTQRDFIVTIGGSVDTVHVHYRTVPIDVVGDAFDFSGAETVTESAQLMILRRPTDGTDTVSFSIPHPLRGFKVAGRLVPRVGAPTFSEGASWPFAVDAAPPSVNAKLLPVRSGTTADLSVAVAFGVSDGPVTVDVFEGDVDEAPLLTVALSSPATLGPGTYAVLGARPLPPGKDALFWRVRVTDVDDGVWWFGPASANRDPLPGGTVTVNNYHSTPDFICAYDTDTDAIRITHAGKTKSWNAAALLAGGSVVTWSVGDAFDDASTDAALVVDEARTGYLVEYQGGTTWVTMWNGTLHGTPSNPPTATMRVVKNVGSGTEDLYITPDTQVDEELLVFYRDGDTSGAPVYWLWAGALVGAGARSVVAGTEVGAGDYWYALTGSPSTKLAAIPLTRDQVRRVEIGVEGVDSGMQAWLPYSLSLLEQPWGESLELLFDQSTQKIRAVFVAGAHTLSAFFEFADNESFTSPTTSSGDVADGATLIKEVTLSAAQLGKPWWVRVTPYNAVALAGLSGVPQKASVAVPAYYSAVGTPSEAAGIGTVTLIIDDPGALLSAPNTASITWNVTRAGVYSAAEASSSLPAGGAIPGTYTKDVALINHNVTVVAIGHFIDGSSRALGTWVFDSNKIADVVNATVANKDGTATVTVVWDSDALVGANCARYKVDGGAWTSTVTISAGYLSQFNVAQTAVKQTVIVQAKNSVDAGATWGNETTVEIGKFVQESRPFKVAVRSFSYASGTHRVELDVSRWDSGTSAYVLTKAWTSIGPGWFITASGNARARVVGSTSDITVTEVTPGYGYEQWPAIFTWPGDATRSHSFSVHFSALGADYGNTYRHVDVPADFQAVFAPVSASDSSINAFAMNFGIVGDGSADDSDWAQDALDEGAAKERVVDFGNKIIKLTKAISLVSPCPGVKFGSVRHGDAGGAGFLVTGTGYTAITISGQPTTVAFTMRGTGNAASGVLFSNPLLAHIHKLRVYNLAGFGVKINKCWDCVFTDVSVELCGTTGEYAFSMNDDGDTCNMTRVSRLQVETATRKAIYISPNTLSCVFSSIHSEGLTNIDAGTMAYILGGNSCEYSALRIAGGANTKLRLESCHCTYKSPRIESPVDVELEGWSSTGITLIAPMFTGVAHERASQAGKITIVGGLISTWTGNKTARTTYNTTITTDS